MTQIIRIPGGTLKENAFRITEDFLKQTGLDIASTDNTRPWGGFFCIADASTQEFINAFFPDIPVQKVKASEKLSPKILLVEPKKRLSWQYHHRRSEIWKVVGGSVQVIVSETDKQTPPETRKLNDIVILNQGQRHRLIGTDTWGVIAEIWQHTDAVPSDEDDIVRVEDDFGR